MKIVGVVFADFVESNAGGPAQLRTALAGQGILVRTLQRVARIEGLTVRCLYVRPRDRTLAEQTLAEAGLTEQFELLAEDAGLRPARDLVRTARKWSLEAWRGNPLGMTWFDEYCDPPTLAAVINHYACEALFCFDGHQPVLDPVLAMAMLQHVEEHGGVGRYVFTQAPPGLAGVIIGREGVKDLLRLAIPFGLLLSYRPELAQSDPIIHAGCYLGTAHVIHCAARLTGDTRRSRELLEFALRDLGEQVGAEALCRWLEGPERARAGELPVEVELELTTDDPLPDSTLRPRGARVPRRQLVDLEAVSRMATELARYDDRLVALGGHGDPLQHPQLDEVLRRLRSAGVYGVAITTPLIELSDPVLNSLFENQVDAVEVLLDAHSQGTYARVNGSEAFGRVVANVERLEQARRDRRLPQPIVVCSFTRCDRTLPDMDRFYDHWIKVLGSAVIRGYNDYCGTLPPDSLLPTRPPTRGPCRRLGSRLMLLADGTATLCAQDFRGTVNLGKWTEKPLGEIWNGRDLAQIREAHEEVRLEALPLCPGCGEWSRP
jgi:hypothetical protein